MKETQKIDETNADDFEDSSILVVDDDESVKGFLHDALLTQGYKVDSTEDCEQAKEKLKNQTYDLIISDINLPGISGNDFLLFCKKEYQNVEIILITGDPGLDRAIQAVKDGAFDYIAKPISIEKLFERTKEAIIHSRTKRSSFNSESASIPNKDYSVVRTLGSGNMGVVLLVEKNKKHYAMKILKCDTNESSFDLKTKRFIREAEILHDIDHPNIVKIVEYGISDDGIPFYVMEYISGEPFNQLIGKNSMTSSEKVSIIKQTASALDVVHRKGITHRDVKPANIILMDDNTVKLTDFGIAGMVDSNLTMVSDILGSPAYMSPEAFDSSKKNNARSDIFSLGIIAYELFTGVNPFQGETINEIMHQIKTLRPLEPMNLVPDLDPGIQDIMAKMLAKDPASRFEHASDIVDAFESQTGDNYHKQGFTSRLLRTLILRKPTWQ